MIGLRQAWKRERSFRAQVLFAGLALGITAIFQASVLWWGILIAMLTTASAFEMINAAMEAMMDELHPHHHPAIGAAKDMASAAAFVCNCASGLLLCLMVLAHL